MKTLLKYCSVVCLSSQLMANTSLKIANNTDDFELDEILSWTKKPAVQTSETPQASQTTQSQDPNPRARFGTRDNSNIFLSGEAIWFKPLTNQFTKQIQSTSGGTTTNSYKFYNSNFQNGFRVALGYNLPYDGWDAAAIYTCLNYKHNNPYTYDVGSENNYGSLAYGFYFNQGDLDFGRMFKVSRRLRLRPHVGIRGLWLNQFTTTKYLDSGVNYKHRAKLEGTLVGAEIGLDSLWMLSKNYSIYASVTVPTLVDAQKDTEKTTRLSDNIVTDYAKTNYGSKIVIGVDFAIGFRWDRNLSQDRYHIGINLGYEHHSLINLISQAESEVFSRTTGLGKDQDFSLQGIALGARFDF